MNSALSDLLAKAGVPAEQQGSFLETDFLFLPVETDAGSPVFYADSLDFMKVLKKSGSSAALVRPTNASPKYVDERSGEMTKLGEIIINNWKGLVPLAVAFGKILADRFSNKKLEFKLISIRPDGTITHVEVKGPAKEAKEIVTRRAKEWATG